MNQTQKPKAYWLYLHPHIHLNRIGHHAILYNPLNGKLLEYKDQHVAKLLQRMESFRNLFVVQITPEQMRTPQLANFIKNGRKFYFLDLADTALSKHKPAQFMPKIRVQKTINTDPTHKGEKVAENIFDLFLYLHNTCASANNCRYKNAWKQFPHCRCLPNDKHHALEPAVIRQVLVDLENSSLDKIHLIGGNLLEYPSLPELLRMLRSAKFEKHYYFQCNHFRPENTRLLALFKAKKTNLEIIVPPEYCRTRFQPVRDLLSQIKIPVQYHFVIANLTDLQSAEATIAGYGITNYRLQLFYDGHNRAFFQKFAYMRKSNLLESKIAQKTIFARSKINPRAFGTLYILNNGSILANPSLPPIGNIHTIDIYQAILSEMHGGKTWIGPRNRVIPCKNCVFNCLCPPLSNYESVFARNNLCHIYRSPSD